MYSKETCLQHKLQKPWAKNLINATFYTPVRSSSHCRITFPRPNLKGCLHKFVHFPKILYFIQNIICSKLFVFGIVAMQPKSGDHLKTYLGEIFVIKYKKIVSVGGLEQFRALQSISRQMQTLTVTQPTKKSFVV